MRLFFVLCITCALLSGCDDNRVFEEVKDFEERQWNVTDKPVFEFEIDDLEARYTLYTDVRNSIAYPYSRFFFTYYLQDSTGVEIQKKLITQYLFDAKSGKPFGKSGIGDLYDHRFLLVRDLQFKKKGKYKVVLEQFMRMDTLPGIMAIGLRVEKSVPGETPTTY